jgi:tetratricopeptide (TPR) repeat protein
MSKYDIDLDYVIPLMDISEDELNEILAEADRIISENKASKEELAVAYLKKAQCFHKLEQCNEIRFMGSLYFNKQKKMEIIGLLEKALELSPDMPEAVMRLGITYGDVSLREDNNDKAIELLTKAIQLKPNYAAAYNNRSTLYKSPSFFEEKENDHDKILKAITDLTEAIRIRPFDTIYYFNRGMDYSKLKMYEKALDDYSNAIKFGSDAFKRTLHLYNIRGNLYMELKDYAKAIEDFFESLLLNPNHDDTLLSRGKAYYLNNEKDKAKADFEEYIKRECNTVDTISRKEISKLIGVMPEEI